MNNRLTATLCVAACALLLGACRAQAPQPHARTGKNGAPTQAVGGGRDAHGCLTAAGQSWSRLRGACLQVFAEADIRLPDPADATLAVYALLSPDRQRAEVFAAGLPEGSAVLEAVKGGYASRDGRVRLLRDEGREGREGGWRIVK